MTGESKTFCGWLFFVFAFLLSACAATTSSKPSSLLQLYVSTDGWYRVDGAQLHAAGIDFTKTDPATLQLFRDGREVPIRVQGEGRDLTLDFYGQASDSPYSSRSVYQLRWDKRNGKRIADIKMPAPAAVAKDMSQNTLSVTRPTLFIPQAGEPGEPWFWQALSAPTTTTITVTLQSAVPASAQLHVDLWGYSRDDSNPDHHVIAFFNGTRIADESWDGQGAHPLDLAIPVHGNDNVLRLVLPGDTRAIADVVLLRSVQVTYTRRLVAHKNALSFRGGRGTWRVDGFGRGDIDAFDITDPSGPTRVADAAAAAGGVTFASESDGIRNWFVVAKAGYRAVDRIVLVPQTSLRERSRLADYVIITHPDFLAALEPLVRWRGEHGLKPIIVTTEEIYAEFGFGEESPSALRAYLDALQPKPRFVLLVGKASYDYRNYLNAANQNLVPTLLLNTPHLSQVASDNWYAATAEDAHPAFAIGRIPAKTSDQVTQVINKIIGYESSQRSDDWKHRALFIADDKEDIFADMSDVLMSQAVRTTASQQVNLKERQGDVKAARDEILSSWNAGLLTLTFIGHGSIDTWAEGPLLSSDDLPQLKNGDRLPILFTPTCLDGFFYHPQKDSLTEQLLFKPDGGIIAGVAPTGLSVPEAQSAFMKELFEDLFDTGTDTLGEAILKAKQKMNAQDAATREVIETFGLLGDPALRITHW